MSAQPVHDNGPIRRPERTNATRQKIFEASMDLIGERGPSEVSVDEIATAAGVSKGSVYYNFGSKAELITQLLEYGVEIMETRLQPNPDLPAIEAMREVLGRTLDFFAEYPSFTQLLVSEMWRTPSQWRQTLTLLRERLFSIAGQTMRKVAEENTVRPDVNPDMMIGLTLGSALVAGLDRQVFHPDRTRDDSLNALMTFLNGYLVPASESAKPDRCGSHAE